MLEIGLPSLVSLQVFKIFPEYFISVSIIYVLIVIVLITYNGYEINYSNGLSGLKIVHGILTSEIFIYLITIIVRVWGCWRAIQSMNAGVICLRVHNRRESNSRSQM